MKLDDLITLLNAGYTKDEINSLVSFKGNAPESGETISKAAEHTKVAESEGTPILKDTTIQKATETKENKDDELKLLRDEIKGLKDIVRAQSLLSAETTASNTVSTDNDKAIASIISPETFRNERK
jgi:hypothetical protein